LTRSPSRFQSAADLNPQNARAWVGLSTVYHQRAQRKMISIQDLYTGENLPLDAEVMGNLEQAIQYYQQALDLIPDADERTSTAANAALLGLGVCHRLRGEAYFYNGQTSLAGGFMPPSSWWGPCPWRSRGRLLALVYQAQQPTSGRMPEGETLKEAASFT
jgi:tetratricopeptide (TPR) repeat protein